MRAGLQIKHWMRVALSAMLVHVTVASAQAVDIPLGTPDGFRAEAVDPIGNGRYCISGSVYDDSGPSWSAMVVLVDANSRRVVWRTAIPYPRNDAGNSAFACGSDGHSIYAATVENTNSSESLNQKSVVLNRISAAGKLEKQQRIAAGFDEWFYLLDVNPTGIAVVGGTSATSQQGGPFGSFVAQFNADLAPMGIKRFPSGAFGANSTARLDGRHLLVAGQFLPNAGAGHDGYAVSKIDLDRNRYLWSTYVLPDVTLSTSVLLSPDGSAYAAASAPSGMLTVTALDHLGKVTSTFTAKSVELCHLNAASLDGHTLKIFGDLCKDDNASLLLSVDLVSHGVSATHRFGTRLEGSGFDGGNWIGVTETQGHGPVFRRGTE
jgi:hypothetical protein